jgi:hypothetical protein
VLFRNVISGAGEGLLYCHFCNGILEPIWSLCLWFCFVHSSIDLRNLRLLLVH